MKLQNVLKMETYKFKLPIGDWSGDGHSQCDYYIVQSNFPMKVVRDNYIKLCKVINLGAICAEYEDFLITFKQVQEIINFGLDINDYIIEEVDKDDPEYYTGSKELANLVLDSLMKFNSNLKLSIIFEDIPLFRGGGADYIELPGYGIFH